MRKVFLLIIYLQEVVKFLQEFKSVELFTGVIAKSKAPRATVSGAYWHHSIIYCIQNIEINYIAFQIAVLLHLSTHFLS